MWDILDPDTPGGLPFCIACRVAPRSDTTDDDMVKVIILDEGLKTVTRDSVFGGFLWQTSFFSLFVTAKDGEIG